MSMNNKSLLILQQALLFADSSSDSEVLMMSFFYTYFVFTHYVFFDKEQLALDIQPQIWKVKNSDKDPNLLPNLTKYLPPKYGRGSTDEEKKLSVTQTMSLISLLANTH